ncbi:PREDICTED: uncharacterized protein LOC106813467 [Priapulus caudatus]|uniref:Uncharacterized protein LOC106813467 n=1 Tax=Priapulus caudatus TaxID=37621 RepID=A0ABM1ELM0_PRICU|nr:PREDICTED: uncharacterized protein LOC106813467 [Priapulus caudatus]
MTLEQAINYGRAFEASMSHMEKLSVVHRDNMASGTASVHAFRRRDRAHRGNDRDDTQNCRNCGKKHPQRKCPPYGTVCGACGITNHWAQCCMRKNRNKNRNSGTGHSKSRDRRSLRRDHGRSKGLSRVNSNVHSLNQQSQSEYESENVGQAFDRMKFSSIGVGAVTQPSHIGENRDEIFSDLDIIVPGRKDRNASLKVKVDTGAQGNTLPIRIFRRMCPQMLTPDGYPRADRVRNRAMTLQTLTAYNDTTIKHYGSIGLPCSHNNKNVVAEFYIVECDGPAILGLLSSLALKLVSVHCAITAKPQKPVASQRPGIPAIRSVRDLQGLYPDQFDKIGNFPGEYHIMVDPNIPPVVHAPRKTPIQMKDEINTQLDQLVKQGVIRRVTEPSEWVSSLTYSRKADGSLRICLDPKELNRAILRSHNNTPTLEEITHRFNGARVFSKLDAKNGYWSIKLDAESQLLTTFNTPFGRHCFCRCPFGLVMSQDVFQRKMDEILDQVGEGALGIADDIAVYAENQAKHDQVLHKLMRVTKERGLMFNSGKCQINVPFIKFFGMVYDADGAHPDPDKIDDIKAMPPPENKTAMQEFLGLATYMSPFIPRLSDHTCHLREMLKRDVVFDWSPAHQEAFDKIKQLICNNVTLAYYDPAKETVLQVDASLKGLGAALIQDNRPIMFASKSLSDTEQRYANIERELLAAVFAVERFHTFLYGRHFKIESDHKPLEMISLKNLTSAPPRLQRMVMHLQGYDFTIRYRPGPDMLLADCLSRQPNQRKRTTIDLDVKVFHVQFSTSKIQQLREESNKDAILCALRDVIIAGWPDERRGLPTPLRVYWSFRDELSVENGLIMKGQRVMIPENGYVSNGTIFVYATKGSNSTLYPRGTECNVCTRI